MADRHHVRSNSLPSESHPRIIRIKQELSNLKKWEALSTSTSGSICSGLSGLEELYNCVDDLLNFASTQQVLSRLHNEKCLNELLLDRSDKIIDICSISMDMMLQIKEQIGALQSTLRRRKGDLSIDTSMISYTSFRKKMNKNVKKLVTELKQMDASYKASPLIDQDQHLAALVQVLQDVDVTSSKIFQAFMLFLLTPISKTKLSKWSLVSRLMHKGEIACEEKQEKLSELGVVDASLGEWTDFGKLGEVNEKLEALEMCIGGLENSLGCVFRRLIKTRASLLNTISQ